MMYNRIQLEDKPYNDIVLHLERKMRLNGIETPYEVTLVPLNKIDAVQPQAEVKQTENRTHNTKKGIPSIATSLAISKLNTGK